LVLGKLIRRYKRFLADVLLPGGDRVVAHVPNTGSMMSTREPESEVALSRSANPKRKLPYTLELVRATEGAWVGVNTVLTNHVAAEAIEHGRVPELSNYERLCREVRMGVCSRDRHEAAASWKSKT
jgi:sugar fermentation stimulation protein A